LSANTEAVMGAETLVPPNTSHPPAWKVSYTDTPVLGSASALTSAIVRREQPASFCQVGFSS
jgi:hypothetical protein